MTKFQQHSHGRFSATSFIENLVMCSPILMAVSLLFYSHELYYRNVQEDAALEWASAWSFFIAGFLFLKVLVERYRQQEAYWFCGLLVFACLFVAMEEISWGQRILGYQPAELFLAYNSQQEANFHNLVNDYSRARTLGYALMVFGIILPFSKSIPAIASLHERFGIICAPQHLAASFAVVATLQFWHPFNYTGEWVELMFALGLVITALSVADNPPLNIISSTIRPIAFAIGVMFTGAAFAELRPGNQQNDAAFYDQTEVELIALREDLLRDGVSGLCGSHVRLYDYFSYYDSDRLRDGEFRSLEPAIGLRARYFIDPWHTSYWLLDKCATEDLPRKLIIYSYGANRKRDLTREQMMPDDFIIMLN